MTFGNVGPSGALPGTSIQKAGLQSTLQLLEWMKAAIVEVAVGALYDAAHMRMCWLLAPLASKEIFFALGTAQVF